MGDGLEAVRNAAEVEKNLVIAPSGLKAARYLEKEWGVPYETGYPLETLPEWKEIASKISGLNGKKVLIVHQQILANALRKRIREQVPVNVTVASWFEMDKMEKEEGDCLVQLLPQGGSGTAQASSDVVRRVCSCQLMVSFNAAQ